MSMVEDGCHVDVIDVEGPMIECRQLQGDTRSISQPDALGVALLFRFWNPECGRRLKGWKLGCGSRV